jgi:hypothetical protein
LVFICFSCIESFIPSIGNLDANKYVVSGHVTDKEGYQIVNVSLTTSVSNPVFTPVNGCVVKILDDKGNVFKAENNFPTDGAYKVWIAQQYLISGISFKVEITTPTGEIIASAFDKMPFGTAVDSIYFLRKDLTLQDFTVLKGIQFYTDFDAATTNSHYFKWTIEQTWEIHVPYPQEWFYNGTINRIEPADYSKMVCWRNETAPEIFTLSTTKLSHNKYKLYPLHFVSNKSSCLVYGYSVLITQSTLSEAAYNYWENMRMNSSQQGGLYEKQPLPVIGNLINISSPEKEVLGFFGASTVKSRRFFVKDVPDLTNEYVFPCALSSLGRFGWREFNPTQYPVYFTYIRGALRLLDQTCVDCIKMGGDTKKPDFWPW